MRVTVDHIDNENAFLLIPDEILEQLGWSIEDTIDISTEKPNCIILTKNNVVEDEEQITDPSR
jgi:bifunctional DNA-binding transcriptional regulator/antitoxin component of YhaV-PrlF toxin-antitoxin module